MRSIDVREKTDGIWFDMGAFVLFCFFSFTKFLYIKNERSEKSFYFCSGLHTRIKQEKEKEKNMKPWTLNQNSDRF